MIFVSHISGFRTVGTKLCYLVIAQFALCGLNTGCATRQIGEEHNQQSANAYVDAIMKDVSQSMPWKSREPSNDDTNDPEYWIAKERKYQFKKGEEDINELLIQARAGNEVAMGKLEFYFTQLNVNWTCRFEVQKMLALRRGITEIARFYADVKHIRKQSREARLIEQALEILEGKAMRGNLIHAVALYQFCGSLEQVGETLPLGENKTLSAKWLEQVHKTGGQKVFKEVVKNEAMRMGYAQSRYLDGSYFPHTPIGWKPSGY